jgi:hypothetical protein
VFERHACVYAGRRFAHIVFEYQGQRVSLLVTEVDAGGQVAFPDEAAADVTSAGRIDDMSVAFFRTPRQMVFFAGDVAQPDLVKLADAVTAPLYRALAGV